MVENVCFFLSFFWLLFCISKGIYFDSSLLENDQCWRKVLRTLHNFSKSLQNFPSNMKHQERIHQKDKQTFLVFFSFMQERNTKMGVLKCYQPDQLTKIWPKIFNFLFIRNFSVSMCVKNLPLIMTYVSLTIHFLEPNHQPTSTYDLIIID